MKSRSVKIGCAVPALKPGDAAYNTTQILHLMQEHTDCGILLFPELSLTAYTCGDLFGQQVLLEAAEEGLAEIAQASKKMPGMTIIAGLPVRYANSLYNCAAFVSEGRIAGLVPKTNIPNYSEFYEQRWFSSGRHLRNLEISIAGQRVPLGVDLLFGDEESGALIGTDICEDLWVPEPPSTRAALAGANILINLSASDEVIGKEDYRRTCVVHQSAACVAAYAYASAGMDESSTDLVFSGHAMIAENGRLLQETIFPRDNTVVTALIDLDLLSFCRTHQTTFANVRGDWQIQPVHVSWCGGREMSVETYASMLKKESRVPARMPFVPGDDAELKERCEKILRIQANGLATRVRATGLRTLVIGVSGGLDSTLALLVCAEARKIVPDIRILSVTMPNHGNTSSQTYQNAMALMKALHTEIREVEIGQGVKDHLAAIGHSLEYQGEGDTAYENAQARMRTYILMDLANMENGLVVGTGDLSELALGWCTYNGDHMSMYGVNASVPKTLVRYICHAYALTCGDEELKRVLLAIIDTPISPELTPSNHGAIAQKTEAVIGKYDLNDFFLFWTVRYGFAPVKVLALAMAAYPELSKDELKTALRRFLIRFFHQQFKRSCLPDGPKVGSVTLSPRGDWRMPSDASVNLWLADLEKA